MSDPVTPGRFQFQFAEEVCLIAPLPMPDDRAELLRRIVSLSVPKGTVVAAFTDRDLAERFIARMPGPSAYQPLVFTVPADLALFLGELHLTVGENAIAFDPEPGQPLRHTFFIPKVVDDLVSPHR
jgi:hypothetical protein